MEQRKVFPTKRQPEEERVHLLVCGIPLRDDFLYAVVKEHLDHLTQEMDDPIILHRGQRGVDRLVARWAAWNWYAEKVFHTDAEEPNKKKATALRNSEMVKAADYVVLFWNGDDAETYDVLLEARHQRKEPIVIEVSDE